MKDTVQISATVKRNTRDAIEESNHPEFKNMNHFSTRVDFLLKFACDTLGIEIKPKTK